MAIANEPKMHQAPLHVSSGSFNEMAFVITVDEQELKSYISGQDQIIIPFSKNNI